MTAFRDTILATLGRVGTAMLMATIGLSTSVNADLIFQMDFNDADGNQSLIDRGTTGTTGSFTGGATYSTIVAPSNTGWKLYWTEEL